MKNLKVLSTKEIVSQVEECIKGYDLPCEVFGLETKEDKVLYYQNYLDENNIFRGIIELPSHYYIQLANLLCNTEERHDIFREKFYDAKQKCDNFAGQFMTFRQYLLDNRTEQEMQKLYELIREQVHNKDWDSLYDSLKELSLDYFSEYIFEGIKNMLLNGLTAEDIINWYIYDGNIKGIGTFKVEFVKSHIEWLKRKSIKN